MAWYRIYHGAITANGNTGQLTNVTTDMKVILNIRNSGNIQPELTCGTGGSIDASDNYSTRGFSSDINSSDYTRNTQDSIETERATNGNMYLEFRVTNISNKEKLFIGHVLSDESTPTRWEITGKWKNTAGQIDIFGLKNTQGGSIASGSTITVLGATSDTVTDEKTTVTNVPANTRYEETDTRKIYRFTPSTAVDSSASSLTDVVFDADTMTGSVTYSGNEITRTGSSSWVNGINSNFFFRNSGTQTIECVAQKTGTSAWCLFGLASAKTVASSDMTDQMEYAIRSADDGRTWIRQSSGNWTQVSDTSDNVTFKITNDRTTVTYYANGSSIGTTTHGTPASTYYLMALCAQTGQDGSYKFDYSGDITTGDPAKWTERGTA